VAFRTKREGLGDQFARRIADREPLATDLFRRAYAEGVTLDDVRQHYNLGEAALVKMEQEDEVARRAIYSHWTKQGADAETAVQHALRDIAFFGNLNQANATGLTGDDAPLPWELKRRVLAWLFRRQREDAAALERDAKAATSWNALVRSEIRAGRL